MKSKIIFITFILSLYCCTKPKGSREISEFFKGDSIVSEVFVKGNMLSVVSLNDLKMNIETIFLSELVENCSLVQLENIDTEDRIPRVTTVTEKYIGVKYGMDNFKLFDRSGKFICAIYPSTPVSVEHISDFCIDDKNELIYFIWAHTNKILVYNTSGYFVKEFLLPHWLTSPKISLSNDILTVIQVPIAKPSGSFTKGNADIFIIQFDIINGEVLNEIAPPEHFIFNGIKGFYMIFLHKNTSGIFDFQLSRNDTLYHFDKKKNQILPIFTLTSRLNSVMTLPRRYHYQLNNNLILSCTYDNIRGINKNMVATDLKYRTSSWIKIVNNFYGNLPVMNESEFYNGYYVQNMSPKDLIYDIRKQLSDKSSTERDKKTLKKILSTLDKGSNNVVFIGKLKQ